jgi:hypothetical protein
LKGLDCVVLPAVEAAIDKGLDTPPQRVEQRGYPKGGGDDRELRFLAGQRAEERLEQNDATEVDQRERRGERAVDESAVYHQVYVV